MSEGGNNFFGFDLLFKTVEGLVARKTDVLVVLIHWFLTKNSNFRCIGIGDDRTITGSETGSELLPNGWNDSSDRYTIRYVSDNILYILIGTNSANVFLINLLNTRTNKVSNLAVNPDQIVEGLRGNIQAMVPSASNLLYRFRKELLEPVFTGNSRDGTTQTQIQREISSIMSFDDMRFPPRSAGHCLNGNPLQFPRPLIGREPPLRDIGRGDLMPGGGGGMLMDPPRPRPFGSRPGPLNPNSPGPRIDPTAPPGVRPNPDDDHFRPPRGNDWEDNMYM